MALFSRFFSPRRNQRKENNVLSNSQHWTSLRSLFVIRHDQVRTLLFRECDWRGRKLLFDSSSVQKVPVNDLARGQVRSNSKDSIFEISNGFGYQYTRPCRDVNSLGETIFGSVALSQRRSSIKVHFLSNPRRIMLSSVIYTHRQNRHRQISDRSLDDSYGSSINSMSDYCSGSSTEVKSSLGDSVDSQLGHSLGNCDSLSYCPIHCSSLTPHCNSTVSNGSNQSGGSLTSLRRRWLRSVSTSMNIDLAHSLMDVDSTQTTESNSSNESTYNSQSLASKRTKLGVAVIITLQESHEKDMEEYLLQRIPLLVHLITRLQLNSERAYTHKVSFVQLMMEATADTTQALLDMLSGVCMEKPLWLMLSSRYYQDVKSDLVCKMMKDLGYLLQSIDTKHTNFFLSTLLTAVLTHHLGWVPTVAPEDEEHVNGKENVNEMLSALSQSHPYSPLWAQLSDLQGALGFPPKVAKTVIIGQSENLIYKILSVLTYFIRCGQVFYTPEQILDDPMENCLHETTALSTKLPLTRRSKSTNSLSVSELNCHSSSAIVVLNKCNDNRDTDLNGHVKSDCNEMTDVNIQTSTDLNDCNSHVKSSGLKRMTSCKKLSDMNLSDYLNERNRNLSENDLSPRVISDKVNKLCRVPKSAIMYHIKSTEDKLFSDIDNDLNVKYKTFTSFSNKVESEKQMASVDLKNCINTKLLENCEKLSYICENILDKSGLDTVDSQQNYSGDNNSVVFVLGDNEELATIKNNNINNNNIEKLNKNLKTLPAVYLDKFKENVDKSTNQRCIDSQSNLCKIPLNSNVVGGLRSETGSSNNDFFDNDRTDRESSKEVIIFKPTVIDAEDCKTLPAARHAPPLRCLSIPDGAMLVSDAIKEKRARDITETSIKRWLSDNDIYNNKNKSFDRKTLVNGKNRSKDLPSSKKVFSSLCSLSCENISSNTFAVDVSRTNCDKECIQLNNDESISENVKSGRITNHERTSDQVVDDSNLSNSSDNCEQLTNLVTCEENTSDGATTSSDIYLPLPRSKRDNLETEIDLVKTMMGGVSDHYIPSLVLQGIIGDGTKDHLVWESALRRDLQIEAHSPVLNQEISEAVCIIANVDTWEVQLVSSHTLVVEKILKGRSMGIQVGMSQLVANMLETVHSLLKVAVHPNHCVSHIEAKLGEFWLQSHALSELLLGSEFLDIETLVSALDLDPNDVPLLLSVASVHSPQVTKKYGLSFQ